MHGIRVGLQTTSLKYDHRNCTFNKADEGSPYYLHLFDHSGLIFITHPLNENGDNYFTWRRNFMNALNSKNKIDFVNNVIKRPDANLPDF